jgi:hypothetical protein
MPDFARQEIVVKLLEQVSRVLRREFKGARIVLR